MKDQFGSDWHNTQQALPADQRHPLLDWLRRMAEYMSRFGSKPGQVNSAPFTGAIRAVLDLAYRLYLIDHNVAVFQRQEDLHLHSRLLERLRDSSNFLGAMYETFVASVFIKAGFKVEFIDETNARSTHCEFVATSPTGNRYSLEAKSRVPGKETHPFAIGNQLFAALCKAADHPRVIFIEMAIPDHLLGTDGAAFETEICKRVRNHEVKLRIDGRDPEPAYLFFTNHGYLTDLDGSRVSFALVADGFKMPDFGNPHRGRTFAEAFTMRKKHRDMIEVLKSIGAYRSIPSTFDGESPAFAFASSGVESRLRVGATYLVTDSNGVEHQAVLIDGAVDEAAKVAACIYRLPDGSQVMATESLTAVEWEAYLDHPETFFGIEKPAPAKDIFDLYDFFFASYGQSSKETLLRLLADSDDLNSLKLLGRNELAEIYCQRLAAAAWAQANPQIVQP